MKLSGQAAKATLANWQAFAKSPNFMPLAVKFSIFLLIPLVTYFQDIVQVFNLAWSDAEAQYVLLVPFVVAYFFYRRRRAFLVSRQNSKLQDLLGISLSLLALLIYVLGSYSFYALQLHLLSLPIFVAAVTLLIFGADALKLLVFPIVMLTFLSPFPLFFMDALGGNLMSSDGALAAAVLSPFMPIDIVYQPIVVLTTLTTAGETIQFSLSAACSGIYSLTAFLFCAVVFGYLASGSIVKKILYGVIAVIAAYFLNVFRIVTTVLLGRFFGLGIAVEFFHAVGGTVLAFVGTLVLLYFGSKLLKLSFIPKRNQVCLSCASAKDVCVKCGKIVHWPKSRINWKRVAILLVFLVVCADLIAQASAVNYNKIVNTDESAVAFNPSTGELSAFSNQTGWSAVFMGRETQAEAQLGLVFVGDYFLTKIDSPSDTVYAIFEVSDLQSKFHTWEGCLNYQAYPIHVESIKYATIYDQNTNIVNGEIITANAPTLNQSINLVYWFDSLNLKTNDTVTSYSVKITLIKYVPNVNGQIDQAGADAATAELLTLSQSYENIWSQYKQSNSTFVVDLYHNGVTFAAVVTAILAFSIAVVLGKWFLTGLAARKKIAGLSQADKAFLEQLKKAALTESGEPLPQEAAEKIEMLRQQKVIYEKISARNDEIYSHWVPY